MKSNYKQLGKFIRQVDVRNTEGKEENLHSKSYLSPCYRGNGNAMERIITDWFTYCFISGKYFSIEKL